MSIYLLIHGAWHGSWCWEKVIPLLEKSGHEVLAPDLPGHGQDNTPRAAVTFASYVQRVLPLLDAAPEPVILVGHNLGGAVISQVAELRPEKVRLLVYLSALLPRSGESAFQIWSHDSLSRVDRCLERDEQAGVLRLFTAQAQSVFYHDCSTNDLLFVQEHVTDQPLAPLRTPLTLTERFARLPRAAILCEYDQVVSRTQQALMYTWTPCDIPVAPLPSGHAAFLSMPAQLAARLLHLSAASAPQAHS